MFLALAFLAILSITVRVVYLREYVEHIPTYDRPLADAKIYEEWAARIVAGDVLGRSEGAFYRAPLYPYLLAVVRASFGETQPGTMILQAGLGLATAALSAALAARWAGVAAGLVTFGILSLYGPLHTAESKLLGTTLGLFLQVAVLFTAARLAIRPRTRSALLLGILLGGLVLTRPFYLLWAPLLPCAIFGVRSLWAQRRRLLMFAAGLLVVVGPVALRNQVIGGDRVLVAANGGMTFFQGNNVENRSGLLAIITRFEMFGSAERQQELEVRVASEMAGRSLRPSEASGFWFRQGLLYIIESPGDWLRLEAMKLFRFVSSFEPGDNYSHDLERARLPVLRLLCLPFGLLLALAVLGLAWVRGCPAPGRLAVLGAGTGFAGCLLFFVSSRYRLEAVPGLAVLAGVAVIHLQGVARNAWSARGEPGRGRCGLGRGMASAAMAALAVLGTTWLPPGAPVRSQVSISLLQVGNAYERRGERTEAFRAYREAIIALPENAFAWRSLLQLTVQDSGAAVALARLETAPSAARDHPEVRHLRGRFLAALGRTEEAIADLTAAAGARPEMREAWFYLGNVLRDAGRYEAALVALREARRTGWPPLEVLPGLSYVALQTGNLGEAAEAARAAMAIDREHPEAVLNLLVASVYLGELETADTLLVRRGEDAPLAAYYRGLVALRRGELRVAREALRKALIVDPGNRRAGYYETLVAAALGDQVPSWLPSDADPLVVRWIRLRAGQPWGGVPTSGPAAEVWTALAARDHGIGAEIVRFVREEEAGLRPAPARSEAPAPELR